MVRVPNELAARAPKAHRVSAFHLAAPARPSVVSSEEVQALVFLNAFVLHRPEDLQVRRWAGS